MLSTSAALLASFASLTLCAGFNATNTAIASAEIMVITISSSISVKPFAEENY